MGWSPSQLVLVLSWAGGRRTLGFNSPPTHVTDNPFDDPFDDEPLRDHEGHDVVVQPRCVYCHAEHYAPAVLLISLGKVSCHKCKRRPPVFYTRDAYIAAMAQR